MNDQQIRGLPLPASDEIAGNNRYRSPRATGSANEKFEGCHAGLL